MRRFLLGLTAGAVGTACMTAWPELLPKLKSDEDGSEEEPAPAQAARKVLGAAGFEPRAYGVGWGGLYGLLRKRTDHPLGAGLAFGFGVWASSYAQLVPLGIYEPPWTYPPGTLAEDLSYHAVYGLGVAGAYAALKG
ncbi:MAG TPA: hypothetical protein VGK69_05290 [Gaiellaceae bacterium]